jgi:hypothetical protein
MARAAVDIQGYRPVRCDGCKEAGVTGFYFLRGDGSSVMFRNGACALTAICVT